MQVLSRLDHTEMNITAEQMKHPSSDIPIHLSSCHCSLLNRFSVLWWDLSSHHLQPDIKDGATCFIWAVLLERTSNLVIDINPTALPTTSWEIKVGAEWHAQVLRVQRSELLACLVGSSSSRMCCRNTLCLYAVGCRTCAAGGRLTLRIYGASGNRMFFFPTGVAEEKEKEKILTLSLMLHRFRLYSWKREHVFKSQLF